MEAMIFSLKTDDALPTFKRREEIRNEVTFFLAYISI